MPAPNRHGRILRGCHGLRMSAKKIFNLASVIEFQEGHLVGFWCIRVCLQQPEQAIYLLEQLIVGDDGDAVKAIPEVLKCRESRLVSDSVSIEFGSVSYYYDAWRVEC